MVFRREGRPGWSFQARTPRGWKPIGTGTSDKKLAHRIEHMWEVLAVAERAWDLLEPIIGAGRNAPRLVGQLYDLWTETKHDVPEMRRRMADIDLAPLIEPWLAHERSQGWKPDTIAHLEAHVRWLIPDGASLSRSRATSAYFAERLAEYPGEPATRRKVHADWSTFFGWLVRPRGVLGKNPMADVDAPALRKRPVEFYELDTVERIVDWQPTTKQRAFFALLYGTSIEVSIALTLTRGDVWPETREVRAPGTKAHTRDRVVRVADWAWDRFWVVAKAVLPTARIFDGYDRWTVSDWHRQAVGDGVKDTHGTIIEKGLELEQRYPLKNARHHWAVRMLRAGTPVAVVQHQLGHATAKLTLDTYGVFVPSAGDRAHWDQQATARDVQRREAQ